MIDSNDEALLNARLDGALSSQEARHIDEQIEHSTEIRRRAAELERLESLLNDLAPSEPPHDLVSNVMEQVAAMTTTGSRSHTATSANPDDRAAYARSRQTDGGVIMARKAMWALAAAAAVVLGVLTYRGFPSVRGTEATVGAAKRAQTPQMASDSVGTGGCGRAGVHAESTRSTGSSRTRPRERCWPTRHFHRRSGIRVLRDR